MLYCKTLHPEDYKLFDEDIHIQNIINLLNSGKQVNYRMEHPHRKWEYGIVLHALRENGAEEILDVGGGGSVFAPSAEWVGIHTIQIDPGDVGGWISEQNQKLNLNMDFIQEDFMNFKTRRKYDAVVAISTIEHISNDLEFIKALSSKVRKGGLLAITTDFHPSEEALVSGHVRTYSQRSINTILESLPNFCTYGDGIDYSYEKSHVNSYNFASIILEKC